MRGKMLQKEAYVAGRLYVNAASGDFNTHRRLPRVTAPFAARRADLNVDGRRAHGRFF
ncbi:MAG TPA: hypothetical protein VKX28_33070 [Xanthobacteraceae bacterium]|nr:hypothetical protein [Xanthobacteraceae bacterium]